MSNSEINSLSLVEYVEFLISMSELTGKGPHSVNWDYRYWYEVVDSQRYSDTIPLLAERGYHSHEE